MEIQIDTSGYYQKALAFSVLVHVSFMVASAIMLTQTNVLKPERQMIWVEVVPPPANDKINKRIVQSNSGEKTETAAPDAYLGKETRTVREETVSRGTTNVAPIAAKSVPRSEAKAGPASAIKPFSRLGLAIPFPDNKVKQNDVEEKDSTGRELSSFKESYGQEQTEYIKGLKESEVTALNTKEYIYFSYFQRVRDQLDHVWRQELYEKLARIARSGRSLASEQDHITRTLVTLDTKGEVIRIQILEESGTRDLDDAALKAFNKGGPFPNPPTGLVDQNGLVNIRWDFILRT